MSGLEMELCFSVEESEREGVAPFLTVDQEIETSSLVRAGR